MKLSTIVAGSVLLLNGPVFAQEQSQEYHQQFQEDQGQQREQLTSHEVRQFVSGIERDVNDMVQSGDLSRLREWTQNHVADHAVLSRTNSIETEGHSRVMSTVTVTKPDLLRLQRLVFSNMAEKFRNLQDFRLNIQVLNVEPVGDSAAIVRSRVTERATLASRRGEGGNRFGERQGDQGEGDFTTGQGSQSQMQGGEDFEEGQQRHGHQMNRGEEASAQLESQADCSHLIERNRDDGHLQIGMGVCNATTRAQL